MRLTRGVALTTALLLLCTVAALAQEPALQGTITLKGGKTLTGEIKVAQVGVLQGSGIGTLLPGLGSLKLKVDDQVVEVKAPDLAAVEITWGLMNPQDPQSWEIKEISALRRDGTRLTGKPTWGLQATSVVVGDLPALYAFPKGEGFSADNLLAKVEIAGAMPAVITPPATVPPATTPPATTPPATVPPATTPPATVPPATTPPATVPPAVVPPATTPPAVTPPATTPPVVVTVEVAPPGTTPGAITLGEGQIAFWVTAPKSGEKILIIIKIQATNAP